MKPKEAPKGRRRKAAEPAKTVRVKKAKPAAHERAAASAKRAGLRPATPEDRAKHKVPPAWKHVHVSDDPTSATQAIGIDGKDRLVRTKSAQHSVESSAQKFNRVAQFRRALPKVDDAINRGVAGGDETSMALMLIRRMGLRPGSDKDTKAEAQAFGATNMQARHVTVVGGEARFDFGGKKGVRIKLESSDPEIVAMISKQLEGKGPDDKLFPGTNDVKARKALAQVAPGHKVKDFRTHLGTGEAAKLIASMPTPTTKREAVKLRNQVGDHVSKLLGNTRSVALGSYIAPDVFSHWDHLLNGAPARKAAA